MVRQINILLTLSCIFLFSEQLSGQTQNPNYWISFTDKDNSGYSILEPEMFLSKRAILRRERKGISIIEQDLPVNQAYLQELSELGIKIINISKWFNGALVSIPVDFNLSSLNSLPFVLSPPLLVKSNAKGQFLKSARSKFELCTDPIEQIYGPSYNQLEMIGGDVLHGEGAKGEGMLIAILDAGFTRANEISSLQHIFDEGRVLSVRDFVKDTFSIFNSHNHGTAVFSIIGGLETGFLHGSAPEAEFVLIRTEEGAAENLVEEYNWLSGAEFADSIGVDIINSSLGYSLFDDPVQNHSYSDMDGKTTPISKAATIAADKGIVVVTSAGNSGNNDWFHITAPADAENIMTIGASDSLGIVAGFSSRGPSADNRIKPDVAAQGVYTISQHSNDQFYYCNGTSCSSPVMAGIIACLWSKHPYASRDDLIKAIHKSSSQYNTPDSELGYGIPNIPLASGYLNEIDPNFPQEEGVLSIFPSPSSENIIVSLLTEIKAGENQVDIFIYDVTGKLRIRKSYLNNEELKVFQIDEVSSLNKGTYFLFLHTGERIYRDNFIKI